MRIPSEGTQFSLLNLRFTILKSSGLNIKAKATITDNYKSFKKGERFEFLKTKFRIINDFEIKNKSVILKALAVREVKNEPTRLV